VWEALDGRAETGDEVVSAFEKSFRNELKRKIEGELLSPYGLDREIFLRRGRAYFGDEEFTRLVYQINAMRLETSFLIAGYEPSGLPRLFSITDPGVSENHTSIGFHAVGSGWVNALGSLYRTYDGDLPRDDLIYRVCEAKFLGEKAPGVGKRSFVDVIAPDGTHQGLFPEFVEPLKAIWKKEGSPPIPPAARLAIAKIHGVGWSKEPPS
jgi:hypothetical protein